MFKVNIYISFFINIIVYYNSFSPVLVEVNSQTVLSEYKTRYMYVLKYLIYK